VAFQAYAEVIVDEGGQVEGPGGPEEDDHFLIVGDRGADLTAESAENAEGETGWRWSGEAGAEFRRAHWECAGHFWRIEGETFA
jgi:hypothetical protein